MAITKRQVKIQRRNRVANGNGLRRAFIPTPGDTFIFTERMVVDCILDDEVWVKHFKADGTVNHFCIPLREWGRRLRKTMKMGAVFQPA